MVHDSNGSMTFTTWSHARTFTPWTFTLWTVTPWTFTPWTVTPAHLPTRTFTPWTFTPHVRASPPTPTPPYHKTYFGME